jgi:hypothetical protein
MGRLAVHTWTKASLLKISLWTQAKAFIKSLFEQSWGIAHSEHKPAKNDRVTNRTLSYKRTFICTRTGKQSQVWQM